MINVYKVIQQIEAGFLIMRERKTLYCSYTSVCNMCSLHTPDTTTPCNARSLSTPIVKQIKEINPEWFI